MDPACTPLSKSWGETPTSDGTLGMASCSAMGISVTGGFKSLASQKAVIWGFPGDLSDPVHAWFLGPWGELYGIRNDNYRELLFPLTLGGCFCYSHLRPLLSEDGGIPFSWPFGLSLSTASRGEEGG